MFGLGFLFFYSFSPLVQAFKTKFESPFLRIMLYVTKTVFILFSYIINHLTSSFFLMVGLVDFMTCQPLSVI